MAPAPHLTRRTLLLAGAALAAIASPLGRALAQGAPAPVRLRGAIEAVEGDTMRVKLRNGETVRVALAPNLAVSALRRVSLTDLKANDYIGVVGEPGGESEVVARAVTVFPEAARGTAEGQFPWDPEEGTSMTNATISAAMAGSSGRDLTLTFRGREVKVRVPEGAPVVTPIPAAREDLKPGARVFFAATRGADGIYSAARVTVEKDGVAPPQ